MLGVWRGTHTGQTAELMITSQDGDGDRFAGTLTVRLPAGRPVTIAVRGRLRPRDGGAVPGVEIEETGVVREPGPRSWDLGVNTGRLSSADEMSGSGVDARGRTYSWSFERRAR